jgi:hypothetical protein
VRKLSNINHCKPQSARLGSDTDAFTDILLLDRLDPPLSLLVKKAGQTAFPAFDPTGSYLMVERRSNCPTFFRSFNISICFFSTGFLCLGLIRVPRLRNLSEILKSSVIQWQNSFGCDCGVM